MTSTAKNVVFFFLSLFSVLGTLQFSSAAFSRVNHQQQQLPSTLPFTSKPVVDRASSAIFPLSGNVYPDGIYYVELSIGNPPKSYFLDVDTGSDLTWVQCDAPCVQCFKGPHPLYKPSRNQLVPCEDPVCNYLQMIGAVVDGGCLNPTDQCDYEIEYSDSGSSIGVLVSDTFFIQFTNGSLLHPYITFGCGYDQQGLTTSSVSPTDGVLGLGLGKSSILTQLSDQGLVRSVIGHCLSRRGGGFLFLGDTLIPRSGITWTPMSSPALDRYYSPRPGSLYYGKRTLVSKDFKVVFDSGSSYTYFSDHHYQVFLTMLTKDLNGKPLREEPDDRTLPYCWRGKKPFKSASDFKRYFSSMALNFGRRTTLEIPPENYLITSNSGSVCLGILNGTQAGLDDLNVIGDISLQDLLVIYDNERERIGWARANCDRNTMF